jgi:hypothetical protein
MTVQTSSGRALRSKALVVGFVLLSGLAPVVLALCPRPGEPVAVVTFVPDAPLPRAIAAAGGQILWMSTHGHVAVLHASRPDLVEALYRAGATLVLAASPLSGCLPTAAASSLRQAPRS